MLPLIVLALMTGVLNLRHTTTGYAALLDSNEPFADIQEGVSANNFSVEVAQLCSGSPSIHLHSASIEGALTFISMGVCTFSTQKGA